MKIKTRIFLILFTILVVTITILVGISAVFENVYIDYKYTSAYEYYNDNDVTIDEYANYLIENGFVVSQSKIDGYVTSGELTCHVKDNEIVIYQDSSAVLYAVINEESVNDLIKLIHIFMIIITFFTLLILILIFFIIDKYIIHRIEKLNRSINTYRNTNINDIIIQEAKKDEILHLQNEFSLMIDKIKADDENKRNLILSLSHDLKNPITKIEALSKMYFANVQGYNDKEKFMESLSLEMDYMANNIDTMLKFYEQFDQEPNLATINLNKYLKMKFNDEIFKIYDITITIKDEFNQDIKVNEKNFDLVINNIKSNLYKYSKNQSVVNITIYEKKVVIKNKINDVNIENSSKIGNTINSYLAADLNIEINNLKTDEMYITTIIFN